VDGSLVSRRGIRQNATLLFLNCWWNSSFHTLEQLSVDDLSDQTLREQIHGLRQQNTMSGFYRDYLGGPKGAQRLSAVKKLHRSTGMGSCRCNNENFSTRDFEQHERGSLKISTSCQPGRPSISTTKLNLHGYRSGSTGSNHQQ
jgi:hypothetical protein